MPASHHGYLRAVAAALESGGVPVADWRADGGAPAADWRAGGGVPAGLPRDGWIAFDLSRQLRIHGRLVWDCDQAGAAWAEDRGWSVIRVGFGRTEEKLDIATVAAPGSVLRAVARQAGLTLPAPATLAPAAPDHDVPGHRAGALGRDFPDHWAGTPDHDFPDHWAGTPDHDFPDHRAGAADPAFERAIARYASHA
jgi:hypothetical protein